jgi:hypothetical protein
MTTSVPVSRHCALSDLYPESGHVSDFGLDGDPQPGDPVLRRLQLDRHRDQGREPSRVGERCIWLDAPETNRASK